MKNDNLQQEEAKTDKPTNSNFDEYLARWTGSIPKVVEDYVRNEKHPWLKAMVVLFFLGATTLVVLSMINAGETTKWMAVVLLVLIVSLSVPTKHDSE